MIDTLEANRIPVNRFKGEVFCSRYGIHVDWYKDQQGHMTFFAVMDRIDGTKSIAEIARDLGLGFDDVHHVVEELARRDLVSLR